ncbi:hypothetical protein MRX96_055151 [Rhipicephalus microplus]
MSSYELPANASEDALRGKIVAAQGYLRSLNLSNCIVAEPASLLSLVSDVKKPPNPLVHCVPPEG